MEPDYPSKHGGKMPCLDIQVWIDNGRAIYDFYSKPMASPYIIMAKSAVSMKVKRNVVLQEGLRRIRRTSPDIPMTSLNNTLSKFSNAMRISGYDRKFRYQAIKGILDANDKFLTDVNTGSKSLYRSGSQIRDAKKDKLGQYGNTWFMTNGTTNTIQVQATPNSNLVGMMQSLLDNKVGPDGGKFKVSKKANVRPG